MLISGIFSAVVIILMLVDYQRKNVLASQTENSLARLRVSITADPEAQILKENFANLEVAYRRLLFVNDTQNSMGVTLIFIFLSVLLFSSALYIQTSATALKMPDKNLKLKISASKKYFRLSLCFLAFSSVFTSILFYINLSPKASAPQKSIAYTSLENLDKNWTSLRGSRNDGISRNIKISPDVKLKELWKAEIDLQGYNSPLCYDDKIFFSAANESVKAIYCYSQEDGKLIWKSEFKTPVKSVYDDQSSPAPSTMSVDESRVYAIFPSGELFVCDKQGKTLYSKNFGTPEILYAYASSLIVCEKYLIVQMDLDEKRTLFVLDCANGNEIWKRENGGATSWSTPTIVEHNSEKLLCIASCASVEVFELKTGKLLWKNECLGGEMAASMTYSDGKLYVANDGVAAYALNITNGEIIWKNDEIVLPSVASPVCVGNELYIFSSGGTVTRLDCATGKLISEKDNSEGFYSSPIFVGETVVACDNAGKFFLFKASSDVNFDTPAFDFKTLIYATPAFAADKIFVRTESNLFALKIGGGN